MISDFLPPRQTKTKIPKKLRPSEPIPAPLEKIENTLADFGPLDLPNEPTAAKKLSKNPVKNLKNLHPKHWYNLNKTEKLMSLASLFVILVAVWGSWYVLFTHNSPDPVSTVTHKKRVVKPAAPITVASPLTGVQVDPTLAARPVTGIMIENSTDARPQSGIQDAGVVFEAIAEGGITRFLTLYQDSRPQYIGPVRSLRPYYIDWATPFDAGIAHVGGSPDALSQIRSGGKDLDQFFNGSYYWRQSTRIAPHNVYTSFDKLDALNAKKGYTASHFTSWPRKAEKALATPTTTAIDLNISSYYYNVHYAYDKASNSYLRSEGGQPHMATASADDKTGQQLHPKVVIALVMGYGIDSDGKHSIYSVNGSGNAYVFQDGSLIQGTWSKADRSSQISFTDASGQPIKLDPGQTWISVVSDSGKISYK